MPYKRSFAVKMKRKKKGTANRPAISVAIGLRAVVRSILGTVLSDVRTEPEDASVNQQR